MATEAQRRAYAKYDSENTIRVTFKVNKNTESDIADWLSKQDKKQGAIKAAIREQIKRENA